MSVGTLNVATACNIGNIRRGIADIRKELGSISPAANASNASLSGMSKGLAGVAMAGAAAAAAAAGVWSLVSPSMEEIDGLAKAADKMGIATEKLSGLHLAADETGIATAMFDKGLVKMLASTDDAARGIGAASTAFAQLGLSAKDMLGMSPDEQFHAIAAAMERIPTASGRLNAALGIFGKGGADLVNVLAMGKAGLNEAQEAAERMGLAVSRVEAEKIEKANDAMGRIDKSVQGLGNTLAIGLAPAIESTSNLLTSFVVAGIRDVENLFGLWDVADEVAAKQRQAAEQQAQRDKAAAIEQYNLTAAYEKQLAILREKTAFEQDAGKAQYDKDVKQFGAGRAGNLQYEREKAEGIKLQREKEEKAAQEAAQKKREQERQAEQKAREKERSHLQQVRRDSEAIAKLRNRVKDFGKTGLEQDESELLRTLKDPKLQSEAREQFTKLKEMQGKQDELDRMKEDRKRFGGRSDDKLLDARTAEGWAALRNNAKDLQIVKMDQQIELAKQQLQAIKDGKSEEVIKF